MCQACNTAPDRRPRVARAGLHETRSTTAEPFERRYQQRVQTRAPGQAQIPAARPPSRARRLQRALHPGRHVGTQRARDAGAVVDPERSKKLRAESAVRHPLGVENERSMRGQSPAFAGMISRNRSRNRSSPVDGQPLHFVLVGIGLEPEQLGDAAIQIAERIGIVNLFFLDELDAGRLPARPERKSPARSRVSTVASENGDA